MEATFLLEAIIHIYHNTIHHFPESYNIKVDLRFTFKNTMVLGSTGKQLVNQICLLYVISALCCGVTEIFTILGT
jgi:hypothetical protein